MVHHGRMSELTRISAPDGVAPAAQYSHVVLGTGRFVAVSGQLALDEDGKLVGQGDPAAQARQVFENLRRCLAAAGATFDDVVKLTYFVTDMAHMPAIRTARVTHIPDDRLPASSAVQVASLVRPEFLMEVEAFAVIGA
jgi:enamine deaminase RidA (YjgF/YER057c/UK114 family)